MRSVACLAVVVVASSCASSRGIELRERARIENEQAYRSDEGFAEARWGMSRAELASLYPDGDWLQGSMERTIEYAGRPARVSYVFEGDHLAKTLVLVEDPRTQAALPIVAGTVAQDFGDPVKVPHEDHGAALAVAGVVTVLAAAAIIGAVLLTRGNFKPPSVAHAAVAPVRAAAAVVHPGIVAAAVRSAAPAVDVELVADATRDVMVATADAAQAQAEDPEPAPAPIPVALSEHVLWQTPETRVELIAPAHEGEPIAITFSALRYAAP